MGADKLMALTTQELLQREKTHYGDYHDIGVILDDYSTEEIFKFAFENFNMKIALRYYLEQQVIGYIKSIENLKINTS